MNNAAEYDIEHISREGLLPNVTSGLNEQLRVLQTDNTSDVDFLSLTTRVNELVTGGPHQGESGGGFFYTILGGTIQVWDKYKTSDVMLREIGTRLMQSDPTVNVPERAYRLVYLSHNFPDGNGRTARSIRQLFRSLYRTDSQITQETVRTLLGVDKKATTITEDGVAQPDPEVTANYTSLVNALGNFIDKSYPLLEIDKDLTALPVMAIDEIAKRTARQKTVDEVLTSQGFQSAQQIITERSKQLTPVELMLWGNRLGIGQNLKDVVERILDGDTTKELFSSGVQAQIPENQRELITRAVLKQLVVNELKVFDLVKTGDVLVALPRNEDFRYKKLNDEQLIEITDTLYGILSEGGIDKRFDEERERVAREFVEYYVLEDEL